MPTSQPIALRPDDIAVTALPDGTLVSTCAVGHHDPQERVALHWETLIRLPDGSTVDVAGAGRTRDESAYLHTRAVVDLLAGVDPRTLGVVTALLPVRGDEQED